MTLGEGRTLTPDRNFVFQNNITFDFLKYRRGAFFEGRSVPASAAAIGSRNRRNGTAFRRRQREQTDGKLVDSLRGGDRLPPSFQEARTPYPTTIFAPLANLGASLRISANEIATQPAVGVNPARAM